MWDWNDFVFLARLLVLPPDQDFHEDEIGLLWQFLYEDKSWFGFH